MKKSHSTQFLAIYLITAVLSLTANLSYGQFATQEAANNSEHPLIAKFPDSELIAVTFSEDINYRLVLGSLQRSRGDVFPEESERLRGNVTRITYEVSQEFTGEDVYQYFSEQIASRGYTELFTCQGRACGSSNYWANDIFGNRILYGPERNQFYLASRVNSGEEIEPSISLYIITRGNRKIYAYLEILESGGEPPVALLNDPSNLLAEFRTEGMLILSGMGLDLEYDDADQLTENVNLTELYEVLRDAPELRVYLVAHLSGSDDVELLKRRSLSRAMSIRSRLIALGIAADRISAQGVGPLAPTCAEDNCADRVELLLR